MRTDFEKYHIAFVLKFSLNACQMKMKDTIHITL